MRISQTMLSELTGIPKSSLSLYLSEKRTLNEDVIITIVRALGGEYISFDPKIKWVKKFI